MKWCQKIPGHFPREYFTSYDCDMIRITQMACTILSVPFFKAVFLRRKPRGWSIGCKWRGLRPWTVAADSKLLKTNTDVFPPGLSIKHHWGLPMVFFLTIGYMGEYVSTLKKKIARNQLLLETQMIFPSPSIQYIKKYLLLPFLFNWESLCSLSRLLHLVSIPSSSLFQDNSSACAFNHLSSCLL